MTSRAQQRRSVVRRAAILDAARTLLAGEGMKAVSHRRVAEAAAVPIGSIGYCFTSREELLVQCLAADEADRAAGAREARADASPALSPDEVGARAVRTIWGDAVTDLVGLVGAMMDGVRESPVIRERMRHARVPLEEDLRALLVASGYSPEHAGFVLAVVNGSIVNAGVEGYVDEAAAHAARDVGALLERPGRE